MWLSKDRQLGAYELSRLKLSPTGEGGTKHNYGMLESLGTVQKRWHLKRVW